MVLRSLSALGAAALLLSGCGALKPSQPASYNDPYDRGIGPGGTTLFGPGGLSLGIGGAKAKPGPAIGVNAYLWRGALDTLSFMPLQSADPFGGVIITGWYQPPATPDERFKATAYILGRSLRADGVKVSLFRQTRTAGQWVDAPVDPSTVTAIENKILERARELAAQSNAAG
ncbi:MAG: DUF3576 domain-containing protein [Acetobacteraceae bacterium]